MLLFHISILPRCCARNFVSQSKPKMIDCSSSPKGTAIAVNILKLTEFKIFFGTKITINANARSTHFARHILTFSIWNGVKLRGEISKFHCKLTTTTTTTLERNLFMKNTNTNFIRIHRHVSSDSAELTWANMFLPLRLFILYCYDYYNYCFSCCHSVNEGVYTWQSLRRRRR